jgi:cytoskeletal protein RodZ
MKSEEKSSEEKPKPKKSWKSIDLKPSFSFSPMTKWILTILILGVGVVLVVVFYAREQTRNSDLKEEVGDASAALVQKSLERKGLESRLAVANLSMAELATQFPSARQSMDVEDLLFSAAADSGLAIDNLNCPEPKDQKLGTTGTYQAYQVSVSLTGDTEGFLRFIGRLGYWLPSASIDSVSMSGESMTLTMKVYAGVGE